MDGSPTYQLRLTGKFERTLRQFLRGYRKEKAAEKLFREFIQKCLKSLVESGGIPGAEPEPWPGGGAIPGCVLWKFHFRVPARKGAAGEGRIIYHVNEAAAVVTLIWIYTHEDYSKRPPDHELREVFKEKPDEPATQESPIEPAG